LDWGRKRVSGLGFWILDFGFWILGGDGEGDWERGGWPTLPQATGHGSQLITNLLFDQA